MKKEYDFSKGERGKFYRPAKKLEIPVYLSGEVKKFFAAPAGRRGNVNIDRVVNKILKKEIERLKAIGSL